MVDVSQPLSGEELDVWRGLVRVSLNLPRLVDADMQNSAGLSLPDFSVLVQLHNSPRPLRVTEIARQVGLSVSRVSRAISGLESRGLVSRSPSPTDGRGAEIVLQDTGRAAVRRALPLQAARARQLAPAGSADGESPGTWLNRIADRIDAETALSTLPAGRDDAADNPPDVVAERVATNNHWADALALAGPDLARATAPALRAYDLTGNAFAVLEHLDCNPANTSALARALSLTDAGVTKILNRLLARGWVTRSIDPADARASILQLTGVGRDVVDNVRRQRRERLRDVFTGRLSDREACQLTILLEQLRSVGPPSQPTRHLDVASPSDSSEAIAER